MIIIRESRVQYPGFGGIVRVPEREIGCEAKLRGFTEWDFVRLIVFRVDGHYTGNGIIEKFERQISVSIINQDIVRVFRYPVVDVRVFGNFRIPAG